MQPKAANICSKIKCLCNVSLSKEESFEVSYMICLGARSSAVTGGEVHLGGEVLLGEKKEIKRVRSLLITKHYVEIA
ncbi:hypothetical protein VNO77_23697 [Canavalia gladiata]|uniref:Uncharacterized protein n=1 Tax=Canavalia gladiata TaxID=3824 RepID=A0AAN9L7C5_CANGL